METTINPPSWIQKTFFVVLTISLVVAGITLEEARKLRAARDHQEMVASHQVRLSNVTLSLAEEFNRQRWIRNQGMIFIRRLRSKSKSGDFSAAIAEKIGKELVERFPRATVFSFDRTGKLAFQTGKESKRSREIFWDGVLAFQGEHGGDPLNQRFQLADRFCKGIYGNLTSLSDLVDPDGFPQSFLERGKTMYSWVFPQELLTSPIANSGAIGPPTPSAGSGGIWLLIDPTHLPADRIARQALKSFQDAADTIMVVRKSRGKLRIERKIGRGGIPASTAEKFLQAETECEDRNGLWVGRYIPGENGRFLIAGVHAKNLEGFFGQWGMAMKGAFSLFFLIASAIAYRLFWRGHSSGLKLKYQVFILFGIVAVFPLAAVIFQGIDLAGDSAQRSRNAWEQRIKETLDIIDRGSDSYREEQARKLSALEEAFSRFLPLSEKSEAELQKLCAGLDKFETLVIDENGAKLNISRNIEKIQRRGEYTSYMARNLARLLQIEGRIPPAALSNAPTLVSGHALENLINILFRRQDIFDRLRIRDTALLQKKTILSRPGTQPLQAIGLISWLFDESEFMKDYVEKILREASENPKIFHPLQIGFATTNGKFYPPELETSPLLRIMAERVGKFQSSETGIVPFLNGKSYLTTVFFPIRLGGLLLIGMIETREAMAGAFDFGDLERIFGLKEYFPLEKDRIFALRVLSLSIFLSLLLMIPMAVILSRWIVGRVLTLQTMVEEISRNHLDARAPVPADDELGELALALNEMAGGLQERERMSRFVSDQVLEEVKKDDSESLALGGEKREVAVLFTHIHHFNELLERHSPEKIIVRLNEYFTLMNAPIKTHHGSIDKFIGDAIMAVFFHVPGKEHPSLRAVRAAQDMFQEETQMAARQHGRQEIVFRTDIGIHFGHAISGKVGSKYGMLDFTVIGDTVNTAARIQNAAARQELSSILISEEVLKFLPAAVGVQKLDQVSLKGKSRTLDLYKVIE